MRRLCIVDKCFKCRGIDDVFILYLETKLLQIITQHTHTHTQFPPRFSPDAYGKYICVMERPILLKLNLRKKKKIENNFYLKWGNVYFVLIKRNCFLFCCIKILSCFYLIKVNRPPTKLYIVDLKRKDSGEKARENINPKKK